MTETAPVARSVGWALVESLTLVTLSVVTLLAVARLLGPTDFGVAASVIAIIGLLNTAVEGLFSEALVQRATVDDTHVTAAHGAALGVASLLVALCFIMAGPVAALYQEPRMAPLIRVASFGLIFAGYSGVQSALLRRIFAFRELALRTLAARSSSCAITLTLAFAGYGPWSLIAQYLSATIVTGLALWYSSHRLFRWRHRPGSLGELWGFAGAWLANEMVQSNTPRLYQALAAYLFGPYQFGFIGMAFRIVETMRDLLLNIANSVALPIFARSQHDRRAIATQYAAATAFQCIIALPCFAGLAVCAPTIVEAVLGNQWVSSVPLIRCLALGACAGFTASLAYTVFSALGRPALALPLSLFDAVCSVALLVVFSGLGVIAAGLVWFARQVLSAVVLQVMCTRVLPLRPEELVGALWRPFVLALAFAALLWIGQSLMLLHLMPVARLALLATTAGVLLAAGIALMRPDLIGIVLTQVRRRGGDDVPANAAHYAEHREG